MTRFNFSKNQFKVKFNFRKIGSNLRHICCTCSFRYILEEKKHWVDKMLMVETIGE